MRVPLGHFVRSDDQPAAHGIGQARKTRGAMGEPPATTDARARGQQLPEPRKKAHVNILGVAAVPFGGAGAILLALALDMSVGKFFWTWAMCSGVFYTIFSTTNR